MNYNELVEEKEDLSVPKQSNDKFKLEDFIQNMKYFKKHLKNNSLKTNIMNLGL